MKSTYLLPILACVPLAAFSAPSPELAASQYDNAISAENWQVAASQIAPSDLRRIRTAFARQVPKKSGGKSFVKSFFGDLPEAQISSLTDAEFCAKILSRHFAIAKEQGWGGVRIRQATPLGAVKDGDTTAYVVVKQKGVLDGADVEGVNLTKTLLEAEEWFVEIPKDLQMLVSLWER